MAARYANDIEIAKAQRDFELKKAAYDMEVQTKKAESNLAYELQVSDKIYLDRQMAPVMKYSIFLRINFL